jgi:sulfur relay (sulfurtransferase) complex TusBCD TusD component (DsrE family)
MRAFRILAVLAALSFMFAPISGVQAGEADPLFVNVTTDDPHRANMALTFSQNQFERKHPVTIFLNDRAVFLGSRAQGERFKHHQELLESFLKNGATVLICPVCMKHYGVKESDLIEGIKVGNPDATGAALFRDGTKTLTW